MKNRNKEFEVFYFSCICFIFGILFSREKRISFASGEITTLFGHILILQGASVADFRALEILRQSKQYIFEVLNTIPLISNLKEKIYKHMDLYHKRFPLSESVCIIDGKRILNPENILSFGLLTSNESEEYLFNYLTLNIKI